MKSIETIEAKVEEMRVNFEYHLKQASAWYSDMKMYEGIIKEKEEEIELWKNG